MNNVIGQIFTKFSSSYLTKYQPNYDQKKVFNKIPKVLIGFLPQ